MVASCMHNNYKEVWPLGLSVARESLLHTVWAAAAQSSAEITCFTRFSSCAAAASMPCTFLARPLALHPPAAPMPGDLRAAQAA